MRRAARPVPATAAATALLAVFAAGPALAGTPVDTTVPLMGRLVNVEMVSGELTVEGWGGRNVEVKGVLLHECEELEVSSDSERVSIEVEWTCGGSHRGHEHESSHLTVRIPREADLSVETISAPISVTGVEGALSVESISGRLDVSTAASSIDLASVSGPIDLIASEPADDVDIETVSGPIEAEIDPASGGTVDIESVSGGVVLKLPAGASASFDVSSFSGRITNGLGPQKAVKTSQYLPSVELSFTLGGGGARIQIETLSGTIELRGR